MSNNDLKLQYSCTLREHCPEAERAADYAVKKTFAIMGVDIDNPKEVSEFQDGLRFGKSLNNLAKKSIFGIFGILVVLITTYIFNLILNRGP